MSLQSESVLDLAQTVIAALDLSRAIADETRDGIRDIPSRSAEAALEAHVVDYEQRLRSELSQPFSVETAEIVWSPKARLRHRPLAVPGFRDRVLLRALANLVHESLPDFEREDVSFEDFNLRPLAAGDRNGWVLSADVASCFQYTDHSLVAERIVRATARADVADAVIATLRGLMDRSFGLPQGPVGSFQFADLILGPVQWRMNEAGFETARYADDFRISCSSATAAEQALERLQSELYAVGWTLNESKTRIRRLQTYADLLLKEKGLPHSIAGINLTSKEMQAVDPYLGVPPVEEEPRPRRVTKATKKSAGMKLLDAALAPTRPQRLNPEGSQRVLARHGLALLAAAGAADALERGPHLVRSDPSLARIWAEYAVRVGAKSQVAVLEAVERLYRRHEETSPWVLAWIAQPLLRLRIDPPSELREDLVAFVRRYDAPSTCRGRALLALAATGNCDDETLTAFLESRSSASSCDAAAASALVLGPDPQRLKAAMSRGYVERCVVEKVLEDPEDTSWL